MSPTKKTPKTKPKTAPKKNLPAKPTRIRPSRAEPKASPTASGRAAPRGDAERRRSAEPSVTRPKEKEVRKVTVAKKDLPSPARKPGARGEAGRSAGRMLAPGGDAKAKLGAKHLCFKCGAKFYDLNKPEPLCPKCGADQRTRPKVDPKAKPASPPGQRRPATRPMVPLLDDDEEDEVVVDDELDLGLEAGEDSADDIEEEEEEEPEEPAET